jgi:hypothetical protein
MLRIIQLARGAAFAAIWIALSSSAAYAHGGLAGPDELGPPVITSAVLGIVCYWAVMLWPERRDGKKPARRARR